jgi:OMF family outer membrane factor
MPLGSGEEKGKYEKSKLDKRQALINFKRLEQRIILEVRDAVRKVDIKYRMLEASTKAKEAREREYEAQEQRFKAGLVSTHDILDYAERLSRAEAGQIKGIIDYNISLIELAKAEGMTLVEENVKIE